MTTDTQRDASSSAPVSDEDREHADPRVAAGEEANALMAKARYDAFRLVTDARTEADTILDEARAEAAEIIRSAHLQAESVVDAARLQADTVRSESSTHDTIEAASPATTEEEVSELEAEHAALTERVSRLRILADHLEERFAALANSAESTPQTVARDAAAQPIAHAHEPPAPVSVKPTLDYAPSVPHSVATPDDELPAPTERGSFYSRRSAKLPSIGDAGGKSALDMMRAIRANRDVEA